MLACFAGLGLATVFFQVIFMIPTADFDKQVDSLARSGFHPTWFNAAKLKIVLFGVATFSALIDVLILWASVALIKRKFWARTFFLVYFTFKIILDLIVAGAVGISIVIGKGLLETGHINSTARGLGIATIIVVGINCLFYLIGFFTLSSKKIKREFQTVWMR